MRDFIKKLGLSEDNPGAFCGEVFDTRGEALDVVSPVDGKRLGRVRQAGVADYEKVMQRALGAFDSWRTTPAPKRGEIVRQMGQALRDHKTELGHLVSYEMGKILPEGLGEVQEMIDIADFAVGLSRQLYGLTMHSERPMHAMYEQWHPLGAVGVISAFNFPAAVWSWNAFLAAVCGDVTVWKPSPKTPLIAIAIQGIMEKVLAQNGCSGIFGLVIGPNDPVGEHMIRDRRLPLISATGSTRMGRHVGTVVAERLGRSLLELGGNNALLVMDDADLELALPAVVFGAVGTAGQRCTSTRRLLVQRGVADKLVPRLQRAYDQVRIGDPLAPDTLMGPLIDKGAVDSMQRAIQAAKAQGGEVLYGGEVLKGPGYDSGCYVKPCIVRARPDMPIVAEETFAPILYVIELDSLDEMIAVQNNVTQGLSSAVFTGSMRTAQRFVSAAGSDCGIANVNIGTSGAEIGGAFGGEKDTGGGREAGSDSWKAYMRRQTQTFNWSTELPLAQGIKFG